MLLTEEHARLRWCPFARVVGYSYEGNGQPASGNRETTLTPTEALNSGARCIASECAAWRWEGMRTETALIRTQEAIAAARDGNTSAEPVGFCGLAGVPR